GSAQASGSTSTPQRPLHADFPKLLHWSWRLGNEQGNGSRSSGGHFFLPGLFIAIVTNPNAGGRAFPARP
ncbi:hypothetical protein M5W98_29790, partial [Paenibacillus apiarius]|nr:hypothetical protein [Paenibacillus apiarius]